MSYSFYCGHNYHVVSRPLVFTCIGCELLGLWFQAVQGHGGYWSHWHKSCAAAEERGPKDSHSCKEKA